MTGRKGGAVVQGIMSPALILSLMLCLAPSSRAADPGAFDPSRSFNVPPVPPPVSTEVSSKTLEVLNGSAAAHHVGEDRTVCGCVVSAFSRKREDGGVFLILDNLPPIDSLAVILPEAVRTRLRTTEADCLYKRVCATGKIARDDKNRLRLVVVDTGSFVLHGEPDSVYDSTAPLRALSPDELECDKHTPPLTDVEARYHAGRLRTVCGYVAGITRLPDTAPGNRVMLTLGRPFPSHTLGVIIAQDFPGELGNLETEFLDKRICVTGTILLGLFHNPILFLGKNGHVGYWIDSVRTGERRQVCGLVASITEASGIPEKPTALALDRPYPDAKVGVFVHRVLQPKFGDLKSRFLNKRICAAGTAFKNEGTVALYVREKEDIVVWTDALREGKRQTVCGRAVAMKDIPDAPGKPTVLLLDRPAPDQSIAVAVDENARPRFKNPLAEYLGKGICAHGKLVKTPNGVAGIVVLRPDDIQVVPEL
jgi:hypothetical protein